MSRRALLAGAAAALATPALFAGSARAQARGKLSALLTAFETTALAPGAGDYLGYSGPPFIGDDGVRSIIIAMLAEYDPTTAALRWPAPEEAPDERHLQEAGGGAPFIITGDALARAAERNGFALQGDRVLFALRGARLVTTSASAPTARLATPDFANFNCLVGVWRRDGGGPDGEVTAFAASTAPCAPLIHLQRRTRSAAAWVHMTPTGLHMVRAGVWREGRAWPQPGALLFTQPFAALRPYGRGDDSPAFRDAERWEFAADTFGDGLFAGQLDSDPFKGAAFASAGGVAVRGGHDGTSAQGAFADFLTAALNGLADREAALPLMLLSGRDVRQAAFSPAEDPALRRLRFGSSGPAVAALQKALAVAETGTLDAATQVALLQTQLRASRRASGILTAATALNEYDIRL